MGVHSYGKLSDKFKSLKGWESELLTRERSLMERGEKMVKDRGDEQKLRILKDENANLVDTVRHLEETIEE